ncbi:hypothetical protein DEO72_LG2g4047 [Vigna unguiculata]|uniref:Uncharacterized protein n=1 Tax=Vigna unguiculata TaxID=3917 RepID=A0A4D6L5F0_VIGUN|nr:hypothetical protein DEO72_LG2g4047 [Vigna unguiculata]
MRELCLEWRLEARCALPSGDERTVARTGRWRLAQCFYTWIGRCCAMSGFVCSVLTLRDATCREVRGLMDHMCWTTGGQVRRVGLRVGRFVEAGPRAGSSPFLFVCGDDRVIRYTGADVDTGGVEDVQMADSPFLFVCGDDRVIRYTGADVDTGGVEDVQMAE